MSDSTNRKNNDHDGCNCKMRVNQTKLTNDELPLTTLTLSIATFSKSETPFILCLKITPLTRDQPTYSTMLRISFVACLS